MPVPPHRAFVMRKEVTFGDLIPSLAKTLTCIDTLQHPRFPFFPNARQNGCEASHQVRLLSIVECVSLSWSLMSCIATVDDSHDAFTCTNLFLSYSRRIMDGQLRTFCSHICPTYIAERNYHHQYTTCTHVLLYCTHSAGHSTASIFVRTGIDIHLSPSFLLARQQQQQTDGALAMVAVSDSTSLHRYDRRCPVSSH
jgi:hypothetical protein